RLGNTGGETHLPRLMVTGVGVVALARGGGRSRGTEALRRRSVALHVVLDLVGDQRHIDGGGEELENEAAAQADTIGVCAHRHIRLDLAGAGRDQDARPFQLDDAYPADIHRRQSLEIAEGRRVDGVGSAGLEDSRALGHSDGLTVYSYVDLTA